MLPFEFSRSLGRAPIILCLGAHPDDIEIGCGGTLLRLREQLPESRWHWVVLTGNEARHAEARQGAMRFMGGDSHVELHFESFRDGYLPYEGSRVKDFFESLKLEIQPDLILTHFSEDRHQDHRLVSNLTWNTWRNHLILEYEIPKYDGDLGQPQSYFSFDRVTAEKKARLILEIFESQRAKEWFDPDVLLSLMRLRGVECNAPGLFAEAYYARKWVWTAGEPG